MKQQSLLVFRVAFAAASAWAIPEDTSEVTFAGIEVIEVGENNRGSFPDSPFLNPAGLHTPDISCLLAKQTCDFIVVQG